MTPTAPVDRARPGALAAVEEARRWVGVWGYTLLALPTFHDDVCDLVTCRICARVCRQAESAALTYDLAIAQYFTTTRSRSAGTAAPAADQGRRDYERREARNATAPGKPEQATQVGSAGAVPSRPRSTTSAQREAPRAV